MPGGLNALTSASRARSCLATATSRLRAWFQHPGAAASRCRMTATATAATISAAAGDVDGSFASSGLRPLAPNEGYHEDQGIVHIRGQQQDVPRRSRDR